MKHVISGPSSDMFWCGVYQESFVGPTSISGTIPPYFRHKS